LLPLIYGNLAEPSTLKIVIRRGDPKCFDH